MEKLNLLIKKKNRLIDLILKFLIKLALSNLSRAKNDFELDL
jgi:hypothetical protein